MGHTRRILLLVLFVAAAVGFGLSSPALAALDKPADTSEAQAPTADFSADRVEVRPEMEIHFIDESTGTVTLWVWDFGDGESSTEQNPTHVYRKNGHYTVTLKAVGPKGADTIKKIEFIRVAEDCDC